MIKLYLFTRGGGRSGLDFYMYILTFLYAYISFLDINNKDIRDANNAHTDSDDEGESMDW